MRLGSTVRRLAAATALMLAIVACFDGRPASAQDAAAVRVANQQFAAAAALHNLKDYTGAAKEWSKFLADHPKDSRVSDARHYLGICKLLLKDYPAAIDAFTKLLAAEPNFKEAASAQLYLGMAQFNAGLAGNDQLLTAAAATLGDLLKKNPQGKHVPQALYYRAEALYGLDQKAEAEKLYARVIAEFADDPLLPDALYARGVALDELNRGDEAQAVYVDFLKRFPQHDLTTDVNVRRAELLANTGKLAEAEKLFAAAAAAPGYKDADYALLREAGCKYLRQDYAGAMAAYDELPYRFPRSSHRAEAQLAAGKSAYFGGNFDGAVARLEPVIKGTDEAAAEAVHWSARALLRLEKAGEALALVEPAIKATGKSKFAAQLALDRADALYELDNRRADALAAYKSVIEQFDDEAVVPHAAYLAAYTALELGRNDEAQKLADDFLDKHSKHSLRVDVLYVSAEALLRDGKNSAAADAYDALLAAGGNRPDVGGWIVRRALALSLAGKHEQVVEALGAKTLARLEAAQQAEALHLRGLAYQALKDYPHAADDFRNSLKAGPERPQADDTMLALAETLRLAGDTAGAKTTLAQMLQRFPQSKTLDTVYYRTAELAYAAGDLKAAEAAYRRVIDDYADSQFAAHARYGLAWSLLGSGDAAGAVAAVDGLLKGKVPAELAGKARYARALANQQLKKFDAALADLVEYQKTKPTGADLADALYVQGICEEGLGRHDAAVATFEKLLTAAPKYSGAAKVLYELGWIHKSAGRSKESTAAFARLTAEHPTSDLAAEAFFHVGEDAYARKDYAAANDAYYEAHDRAKDSAELAEKSSHKLGWTAFHRQNYPKAEEWFAFQQEAYPNGTLAQDAAFMQAEAQFKQGKYKEALAAYLKVKTPQGADFGVLSLLHAGQAAAQLKQWEQSLTLLDSAVAKFPETPYLPEINYERGWAQFNLTKVDEAIKLFEQVTQQTDREVAARARYMIGEILMDQKKYEEAISNFIKAAYVYAYPEWQARAHFGAGRCFEVLKKLDQARQSYQEVVSKFGQSEEAPLAKERLKALGG